MAKTEFTAEAMQARLREINDQVLAIEESLRPLHDEYNELSVGPVRDQIRKAIVVETLNNAEDPLRELRREQSLLARALGGRRISDEKEQNV